MSNLDLHTFLASALPEYKQPPPPRLLALYSDVFRQKQSTPEGYKSTLGWWTNTFSRIVSGGHQPPPVEDKLILHASDALVEELRWVKAGRPLGLGTIVADMVASQELTPLSQFLSATRPVYAQPGAAHRAATFLLTRPLWWALEQLSLTSDGTTSLSANERWGRVKGKYVMKSILEIAANNVIAHQQSKPTMSVAESLHSLATFKQEYAKVALPGVDLSETDLKVLVKYLERDRSVVVTEDEVIKFTNPVPDSEFITEIDRGILEMKVTLKNLEEQVEEIQLKIEERTEKIKNFLRRNSKPMALSYLRSKKQLEELLVKRLGSLETIQSVMMKIESAANELEIMKAYETSAKTLRTILAHPSLQLESIERTMENMSEALADHKEIEDAINLGGADIRTAAGVEDALDEEELAEELDLLVKEKEMEDRAAELEKKQLADEAARNLEDREKVEKMLGVEESQETPQDQDVPQRNGGQQQNTELEGGQQLREDTAVRVKKGAQTQSNGQVELEKGAGWARDERQRIAELGQ